MITIARQSRIDREPTERTIHNVAVRRLAIAETSVHRYQASGTATGDDGIWFSLSVRTRAGEWKFLGRRRTKAELLTLAATISPRHLDGKCF